MKKIKLFIDFDSTIFNTEGFKRKFFDIFERHGFSDADIIATYRETCLNYKYSPENHLKRLVERKEVNAKIIRKELRGIYKFVPDEMYFDTKIFLDSINKDKFEVMMLSMGDKVFQKRKIDNSGVAQYFDKIYICEEQKWNYLKKLRLGDQKFYVIDDRSDTISNIAETFPASIPILIRRRKIRPDLMYKETHYKGPVVDDLFEARAFLNKEIRNLESCERSRCARTA